MPSEELQELLNHTRWADAVIWTEVLAVPGAEEDTRIRQLLHHVHSVQRAYLQVFHLDPGDLETEVRFPWADQLAARFGTVHLTTVRQGLHQIASHSTYHRGQINTRIRELEGEPPLTDFVAWIWAGKPEAEWPGAG